MALKNEVQIGPFVDDEDALGWVAIATQHEEWVGSKPPVIRLSALGGYVELRGSFGETSNGFSHWVEIQGYLNQGEENYLMLDCPAHVALNICQYVAYIRRIKDRERVSLGGD